MPVRVEPSLRRSWHSRGQGLIRLIIVLKTNYFVCFLYSLNTNRIRVVLNVQGAHAIFFFFFFFFEPLKCARINDTSRVIRNPNILHMRKQRRRCCNRAADQRLCFCYIDTVFLYFLNQKFQPLAIFCGSTARFCVGPGWIPPNTGFGRKFVSSWHVFFFCTVTTFCLIRNKHIQQNNASLLNTHPYMSRIARNPVFGVSNLVRHKLCCTATEDA